MPPLATGHQLCQPVKLVSVGSSWTKSQPNRKLQMRIALPAAKQQQQRQLIERVRSSLAGRRQNIHPFWPLCLEPENPQPIDVFSMAWIKMFWSETILKATRSCGEWRVGKFYLPAKSEFKSKSCPFEPGFVTFTPILNTECLLISAAYIMLTEEN